MGLVHVRADLPAGLSTVTIAASGVVPNVFGVPSVLELDYLDVTGR